MKLHLTRFLMSSVWKVPESPIMLHVQLQASAEVSEHRDRKAAFALLKSDRERTALKLRQTQVVFVISLAITWAVLVCRTIARALLVCCFPVPRPPFLHIQPWVGISVGGLLSFFVIESPSSLLLFIITAVLEAALLISPNFWILMVFTFPLLHPLSVFCSTAVITAAWALHLLTLLIFRFLFFLLLLSRGFLRLFWWACFGLGLLGFVASDLCSWTFFTGERRNKSDVNWLSDVN